MQKKEPADWRLVQRQNFTKWEPLVEFLELTEEQKAAVLTKPNFPP